MEPPAKRLRILRSLEVDETDADYIDAKQKQEQKFKGRLESIFAKYENMHDSMSDEIEMCGNHRIVVDRGHMRRLARQVNRKETVLLDSLGLGNGQEVGDASEDEEHREDSEDELAPTQLPDPGSASKGKNKKRHGADSAQSSPWNSNQGSARSLQPASDALSQTGEFVAPQTPNPASNLLQFVQFPQTPAGQQAQTSFYTTLAQTINHAVQQAVAPLFSSILPNAPAIQIPFQNALPLPPVPEISPDKVAPARDPKWFFPPLSKELQEPQESPSSPTATLTNRASLQSEAKPGPYLHETREVETNAKPDADQQQDPVLVAAVVQAGSKSKRATRRTSPRVEIQCQPARRTRYIFTEEDDICIAKGRKLHGHSWVQIRDSREKWVNWPLKTFQRRWTKHLIEKDLHLKDLSYSREISGDGTAALLTHHLPTPSSSEQEDNTPVADVATSTNENIMSSSAHFDADECDLLSLPGADLNEEQHSFEDEEEETFFPDADETILPSVELTAFIDEDTLQQGLLEGSPMEGMDIETTQTIKVEASFPSPTNKRKQTRTALAEQALLSSDTDAEDCEHISSKADLQQDQRQDSQHSIHDERRSPSASIDLVGDDELQAPAPTTPYIKREFSTPPPTGFLFSTPVAQSRSHPEISSSAVKSASGLSRKAYLKQIKQSWTKRSTPAPKTVSKRRSFQTVPMKRAWVDDDESADELGL
jgi:hypothetical protein